MRVLASIFLGLAAISLAFAHEDVVDGARGAERVRDPIQGQGRNTAKDRAYAFNAQYEDNLTECIDRPLGKRWITIHEAIPFAKRVWGVNIIDESNDPGVCKIKFATGFGAIERETALPLFLEAMTAAIEMRDGCYVEKDHDIPYRAGFKNYHVGTVHIRSARPLQPDYEHPYNVDKAPIKALEAEVAKGPSVDDRSTSPYGFPGEKDMDVQADIARIIHEAGDGNANAPATLEKIRERVARDRRAQDGWRSRVGWNLPMNIYLVQGTDWPPAPAPREKK